tara:strand:+ start:99 stop:557 length:459 start_codon:yes stop_codon:yes gene_type:complete
MSKKHEMFVFHSSAVDGSSVGSHDAGTNLDMAAFKVEDLKCITAGNTSVELTFDETGMFNSSAFAGDATMTGTDVTAGLENSLAILTVTDAATATAIVKKIVQGINSNSPLYNDGLFLFDAVNDTYPCGIGAGDVSAINIRRTTTNRIIANA